MHLEDSRSCLEPSGAVVRPSGVLLGSPEASRGLLERSWSRHGASWSGLGDVRRRPLGALRLRAVLRTLGSLLETS